MDRAAQRLVLLGGTSQSGKSTCSYWLASRLGMQHVSFDDYRLRAQVSVSGTDPINYFRQGCDWLTLTTEEFVQRKAQVAKLTCDRTLAQCIEDVERDGSGAIIEGDDLIPEAIGRLLDRGSLVSGAILLLDDGDAIREAFLGRDQTNCIHGDGDRLERFLPLFQGWCEWLRKEAGRYGLSVVEALPRDGCCERIADALALTS